MLSGCVKPRADGLRSGAQDSVNESQASKETNDIEKKIEDWANEPCQELNADDINLLESVGILNQGAMAVDAGTNRAIREQLNEKKEVDSYVYSKNI